MDEPELAAILAARPFLQMHAQDGLVLEGVPLAAIADAAGTPTWVVSAGTLRARLATLRAAFDPLGAHVHYAVKANDHLAVLRLMAAGGAGADVVSGGELQRALLAGMPPSRIVFSGVGKQPAELLAAARAGIAQVNVESAEELAMLSAVASSAGATVPVALRINPDVDAGTHAKITTGRADNKFGIGLNDAAALYARAAALPGVRPVGLALHIGSQIGATAPYRAAFTRAAALVRGLRAAGHAVSRMDCGGGLGIHYRDEVEGSPAALAGVMAATLGGLELELMVEPGRWLAGPAGLLLSKRRADQAPPARRRFTGAGRGHERPAAPACACMMPGTPSFPVSAGRCAWQRRWHPTDVVGPVCETGDTFARQRLLPVHCSADAKVAILDAGAYGSVMSSTYNARPLGGSGDG